jgi:hypothetical protein
MWPGGVANLRKMHFKRQFCKKNSQAEIHSKMPKIKENWQSKTKN